MKARTKLQLRITELSKQLPGINKVQQDWAYDKCLPHLGFANKQSAFCLDCGETFSLQLINRKKAVCPHCSKHLKIDFTRKTINKYCNYFAITHVVEEFQVVQYFELYAYYKKAKPVKHFLHAILEDWIPPTGKVSKIGLLHHTCGGCDSWTGKWEIREDQHRYYYNSGKYEVYARRYHPDSIFKPEYLKVGINCQLSGITLLEAIKNVPMNPIAETLLKAKRYNLLEKSIEGSEVKRYWPSIKIAMRNKYKISDASMWFDYLGLLGYFRKDLHNAKYICPKNLKKEHDRLVDKKTERQRIEELERKKKNIEAAEFLFKSKIEKFIGLQFAQGDIVVKVLESVKEFQQEGDILKHCVFASEYYTKEHSLILSARIDNTPIETIEVDISKFKIIQSRGIKNEPTKYHGQIVSLIKKNILKIKKATLTNKKVA